MYRRSLIFALFSVAAVALIAWVFWIHELQYAAPTAIPKNFKDVNLGEKIDLNDIIESSTRSTVLHFFNPDCPCSKFNMKQFEVISKKYKEDANFYIILQSEDDDAIEAFQDKYELNLPVILDKKGLISDRCGIYSTPQAVILDKASILYFKGNYNQARYCTRKETSFVEIALDSLSENRPLPVFVHHELTMPYGCSLPSDESTEKVSLNLF